MADASNSVNILRTPRATFSVAVSALATAASATDIFTLQGAANRRIEIDRIEICGLATTAIAIPVSIIRRTTTDTTGTSTNPAIIGADSTSIPATSNAVATAYTANPGGLGTAAGTLFSSRFRAVLTTSPTAPLLVDFTSLYTGPIVLNGAAEWICINFNSTTVSGSAIDIYVRWVEYDTNAFQRLQSQG